jgi:hypothetical protein
MRTSKEVCRSCFNDFFSALSWAADRFEKEWEKGDFYCMHYHGGAFMPSGSEPPDTCPFLLEHTVAQEGK